MSRITIPSVPAIRPDRQQYINSLAKRFPRAGHFYYGPGDRENRQNEYVGRVHFTVVLVMATGFVGHVTEYACSSHRQSRLTAKAGTRDCV